MRGSDLAEMARQLSQVARVGAASHRGRARTFARFRSRADQSCGPCRRWCLRFDLDDPGRVDGMQTDLKHHDGGADALVRRPRCRARAHRGAKRRKRIRVGKHDWSQQFCITTRWDLRIIVLARVLPRAHRQGFNISKACGAARSIPGPGARKHRFLRVFCRFLEFCIESDRKIFEL